MRTPPQPSALPAGPRPRPSAPPEPVRLAGGPSAADVDRLGLDYRRHGYARFELAEPPEDVASALLDLAAVLALGDPFVPPLYAGGDTAALYDRRGVNRVTIADAGHTGESHPAFESRSALDLHTDGTLQRAGEIPSAILYCVRPAAEGGESTVFAAVDAFLGLAAEEPELAAPLLDPRSLTRCATVGGSRATATGSVFTVAGGEVMTRYSTTPRDRWEVGRVPGLEPARRAMESLAEPAAGFYSCFRLAAGEGVILANDKVAHGRTGFADTPGARREMRRVLFSRRPGGSLPVLAG